MGRRESEWCVESSPRGVQRTNVNMLAVVPSAAKHENMGMFALNIAPLFLGVDEPCAGCDDDDGVGVAEDASTDDSAVEAALNVTDSDVDVSDVVASGVSDGVSDAAVSDAPVSDVVVSDPETDDPGITSMQE